MLLDTQATVRTFSTALVPALLGFPTSTVLFSVRRYRMLRMEGILEPKADRTYCLTWVNDRESAVTVSVTLSSRP